jgi:hypothetical protein
MEKEFKLYLLSMLSAKQILVLKMCLSTNTPVHFYGVGLGKTELATFLRKMGFINVSEAGDYSKGAQYVPDELGIVALRVKKTLFKKIINPAYYFKECLVEIRSWLCKKIS